MKQITNKEYERYQKYQIDRLYGRILTPDGLRLICAALDYDPEKIGKHMLEMLAKFRNEGIIEERKDDDYWESRLFPFAFFIVEPDGRNWGN